MIKIRRKILFLQLMILAVLLTSTIYVNRSPLTTDFTKSSDEAIWRLPDSVLSETEFTGNKIRIFPPNRLLFSEESLRRRPCAGNQKFTRENFEKSGRFKGCGDNWAVTTTTSSPPSEAVRRFLFAPDWCVVVVADGGASQDYHFESTWGENIVFLSDAAQRSMKNDFVDALPWKSLGRKNVGFLYAVARGAKVIWDFDDDNMLKFWMDGASPDPHLDIRTYARDPEKYGIVEPVYREEVLAYNPYPVLGGPDFPTWPRGFPPSLILKDSTHNLKLKLTDEENSVKFGVLQSLADLQPDFDAIYGLKKETQANFIRLDKAVAPPLRGPEYTQKWMPIFRVPPKSVTPYNAQATLHFYDAFWALYLPVTVKSRVSDIWRSYAAQALFPRAGLSLGFLPRPLVVRNRNPFSYLGDLEAEQPLYTKGTALVEHIVRNYLRVSRKRETFVSAIESIWVDLYERGFVKIEDVFLIQKWIKTLLVIGYRFPDEDDQGFCGERDENVKERIVSSGTTMAIETASYLRTETVSRHRKVTLGFADVHPGSRTDLTATMSAMGNDVLLLGSRGEFKNYPHVNKFPGVSFLRELSPVMKRYTALNDQHRPDWIGKNYNFYKNNAAVKNVDAFICSVPSAMCLLWGPFDRSIVILAGLRYNVARCTPDAWKSFDERLKIWSANRRNVIGATNRYDLEYMRYYTGIDPLLVPTHGGYHLKNLKTREINDQVLIFTFHRRTSSFIERVESYLRPEINSRQVRDSHWTRDFELENLSGCRAIVYLPYSVFSYRISEIYAAGVPLFVPSPKFYLNHLFVEPVGKRKTVGMGCDRTVISYPYCRNPAGLKTISGPSSKGGQSHHPYSPNVEMAEDSEAEMYWLQFADWYEMPYVQIYEDLEHLKKSILEADFDEIRRGMKRGMEMKELEVKKKWNEISNRIWEGKKKRRESRGN